MAKWSEERKAEAKAEYAARLAKVKEAKEPKTLLNKVEEFNGETVPEESYSDSYAERNGWTDEDKLDSVVNTIKFLPANALKNGRHIKENIQAINCFKVTDELIDKAYSIYTHDEYGQLVKR